MTVEELAARVGVTPERLIKLFAGLGEWKDPDSDLSTQEVELVCFELRVPYPGE